MIRIPSTLDDHGKTHWRRHYKQCVENGSLTEQTADSYEILCRMWSMIVTTDHTADSKQTMKFVMAIKWYREYAIPFGLIGKKPPVKEEKTESLADILSTMRSSHAEENEIGETDDDRSDR